MSRGFRGAIGVIADPTRDPMLAWSYETGLEASHDALMFRASVFRTDVTNERVFNPVTLGVSGAGASRRQGVDVRLNWMRQPGTSSGTRRWWSIPEGTALFGAVTVNDARFLGTLPAVGWPDRPAHADRGFSRSQRADPARRSRAGRGTRDRTRWR
ncbi:MAG: TonB-dependent receptor [Gemmatimonadaceae bacterium]|nr:TonB-dependent receptor [Gemmatimonadaceae bacterium]